MTERVTQLTLRRDFIEQAKGMLMVVYGVDSETALDILRSRSQMTNIKTHALARQLVTEFSALGGGLELHPRAAYDHVLLTCHRRVAGNS